MNKKNHRAQRDGGAAGRLHLFRCNKAGYIETGHYALENREPTENRNCLNYPSFAPILRVTYALCLSTFGLMHIMGAFFIALI